MFMFHFDNNSSIFFFFSLLLSKCLEKCTTRYNGRILIGILGIFTMSRHSTNTHIFIEGLFNGICSVFNHLFYYLSKYRQNICHFFLCYCVFFILHSSFASLPLHSPTFIVINICIKLFLCVILFNIMRKYLFALIIEMWLNSVSLNEILLLLLFVRFEPLKQNEIFTIKW